MPSSLNILLPQFTVVRGADWRRLRQELLHGGKEIRFEHVDNWEIHALRSIDNSLLLAAIKDHQRLCATGGLLKDDRKRRISRVQIAGNSWIVKEYRHIFWLKCLSPDQRSWLGNMRLLGAQASRLSLSPQSTGMEQTLGAQASRLCAASSLAFVSGEKDRRDACAPSAPCIAWLRHTSPRVGYLIMEDAGPEDLMLRETSPHYRVAPPLFAAAGQLIAKLHCAGIYHADCKASNFVVREESDDTLRLSLIDCDDVRFPTAISQERAVKNLAQFLGIHWHITDEALRTEASCAFLDSYFANAPWPSIPRTRERILAYVQKLYPTKPIDVMERILNQWRDGK